MLNRTEPDAHREAESQEREHADDGGDTRDRVDPIGKQVQVQQWHFGAQFDDDKRGQGYDADDKADDDRVLPQPISDPCVSAQSRAIRPTANVA